MISWYIFKLHKLSFAMAFFINKKGYPTNKATDRAVHREVAEKKIGRPLRKHEVVHHKDGDKKILVEII